MAEGNEKCDSNVYSEIVERPIDIIYRGFCQIVSVGFENLPELASEGNRSWDAFLGEMWDVHFPKSEDVSEFMRDFMYFTGLVGRFYKINCTMPVDDVFYLLKHRLPNPDTWFDIWYNFHKMAYLVLIEVGKDHFPDVSLYLDLHINGSNECDNTGSRANLPIDDLANGKEPVLKYHITIYYHRNDKSKVNNSRSSSTCSLGPNFSEGIKDDNDKSKVSEISKSSTAKTDLFDKLPTDSTSNDQWLKYGARPKTKGHSLKKCSDAKQNQKDALDKNKPIDVDMCPRILREDKHKIAVRNRSRQSENVERMNKMLQEMSLNKRDNNEFRILPRPSFTNMEGHSTASCSFNQPDSTANAENIPPTERYQEVSLPLRSCEESVKHHNSPNNDKEYFRRLIGKISISEASSSKSDSCISAPFIPETSEENTFYKKYCEKPKDKQSYKKCGCEPFSEEKECKVHDFQKEGASASATVETSSHLDVVCLPKFSEIDINSIFVSKNDWEKMPEGIQVVQEAFEDLVFDMIKLQAEGEIPSSDTENHENVTESNPHKQRMSDDQQDNSFKMPVISLPPRYTRKDDENSFNFPTNIGLQVRECIIRHEMKTYFDNNSFPVMHPEKKGDLVKAMSSVSVAETCGVFPTKTPMEIVDSIYSSGKVNISDASNKPRVLSRDDKSSGYLDVETYEDRISFNWREKDCNDEQSSSVNFDPKFQKVVSETGNDDKIVIIDGEPMPSTEKSFDSLLDFVQKLTEEHSVQNMSPVHQGPLQLLTRKVHTTPENSSERFELSQQVQPNPVDDSDDDMLDDFSDVSLGLSDYYDSLGSVSEIEDDDKA